MTNPAFNLQLTHTIPFPLIDDRPPGLVHSIVQDGDGNLYCSDEFNHLIVSVAARGELRWWRGGRGASPGHFWYPRGMSLGWTLMSGNAIRCLAVCDSWNRRVQLFQADGQHIGCWESGGAHKFGEIADIRFVSEGATEEDPRGYWLVLDKGNHRLVALHPDGSLFFELGQCFPYRSEADLARGLLDLGEFLRVDWLYYPARILGESEEALYLWEPGLRSLKQLFLGNLFLLHLSLPEDGDCFAASEDWILSWTPQSNQLIWHDFMGQVLLTSKVAGRPVESTIRSDEFWLQDDCSLFRWKLTEGTRATTVKSGGVFPRFLRNIEADIVRADEDLAFHNAIHNLVDSSEAFISCTNDLIQQSPSERWDVESLRAFQAGIPALTEILRRASEELGKASGYLFTACLKMRLLGTVACGKEAGATDTGLIERCKGLLKPVLDVFVRLQNQWDILQELQHDIARRGVALKGFDLHLLYAYVQQQEELFTAMRVLQRRLWIFQPEVPLFFTVPSKFVKSEKPTMERSESGRWLRHPVAATSIKAKYLREIDRIFIGAEDAEARPAPYGLARTAGGNVYVTLVNQNQIVCLNERGSITGRIRTEGPAEYTLQHPLGIAADERDRLWVASAANHRILIFDLLKGAVVQSLGQEPGFVPLSIPAGICIGKNRTMLVADYGNNRILRMSESGQQHDFCRAVGTGPGELRDPIALCRDSDESDTSVWVADQLNHRIQELDAGGGFIRQVGSCGLGRGHLLLPEFVLSLSDDMLIISQWRFNKELKIFSKRGEELDHMPLDYAPGGMLLHKGWLLVAEYDGNHIRVYEKI